MIMEERIKYDLKCKIRVNKETDSPMAAGLNLLIIILSCSLIVFGIYKFYLFYSFRLLLIYILLPIIVMPFIFGVVDKLLNEEKILIAIKNNKLYLFTRKVKKIFDADRCYFELFDDGRDRNITLKENNFSFSRYVRYPLTKKIYLIAERIKNKKFIP